jgi:hypothetical protein
MKRRREVGEGDGRKKKRRVHVDWNEGEEERLGWDMGEEGEGEGEKDRRGFTDGEEEDDIIFISGERSPGFYQNRNSDSVCFSESFLECYENSTNCSEIWRTQSNGSGICDHSVQIFTHDSETRDLPREPKNYSERKIPGGTTKNKTGEKKTGESAKGKKNPSPKQKQAKIKLLIDNREKFRSPPNFRNFSGFPNSPDFPNPFPAAQNGSPQNNSGTSLQEKNQASIFGSTSTRLSRLFSQKGIDSEVRMLALADFMWVASLDSTEEEEEGEEMEEEGEGEGEEKEEEEVEGDCEGTRGKKKRKRAEGGTRGRKKGKENKGGKEKKGGNGDRGTKTKQGGRREKGGEAGKEKEKEKGGKNKEKGGKGREKGAGRKEEYVVDYIVERKKIEDLYQSLDDGRYQVHSLPFFLPSSSPSLPSSSPSLPSSSFLPLFFLPLPPFFLLPPSPSSFLFFSFAAQSRGPAASCSSSAPFLYCLLNINKI